MKSNFFSSNNSLSLENSQHLEYLNFGREHHMNGQLNVDLIN